MAMQEDPLFDDDTDDSADEDYVLKADDILPSEEDDDGEPEDDEAVDEDKNKSGRKRKAHQKKQTTRKKQSRKRQSSSVIPDDDSDDQPQEITKMGHEDEKKKTDSLWSDFLKETGSSFSPKPAIPERNSSCSKEKSIKIDSRKEAKKDNLVTITKVFEFAGEKVEVTKEVPSDSLEAKNNSTPARSSGGECNVGGSREGKVTPKGGCKLQGGGGLSALIGQIGKKAKIGTLEKSKIDWDRFKKAENLAEDIEVHNRGREGFMEKQEFLQRTDFRQFEKEKQMRAPRRSNR